MMNYWENVIKFGKKVRNSIKKEFNIEPVYKKNI